MLFATMLALVKLAGESGVALPEILFWRQAVPGPLILLYLWRRGELYRLRTQRLGSHARRAGLGTFSMIFNFGAGILLPLAVATTLGFTTPLFAVVIAALFLRDPVGPWRWTAVMLGFLGVIVITLPGGESLPVLGTACGLIAALMISIINHQIRDLGRTEEPIRTTFYFSIFGCAMAAVAFPFYMTAHTPAQWGLLLGIGAVGTVAQILLSASLRYGAVAAVIVMDYTGLVWATLYGWLIWDRLPPAMTWIGAPLIIASGLLIVWREYVLHRRPSPTSPLDAD